MIHTVKHLYYTLRSSEEQIHDILGHIDNYYYYLKTPKTKYGKVQKGKGKVRYRELFPSTGALKKVQERLNSFLQSNIEFPHYVYDSIKGKNNILNALAHRSNKFFFSVDMKNYFSYITHHQVFKMFCSHNFSPTVSHVLTKLTTFCGSLPRGAPTSPVIANLVFMDTGSKLSILANQNNLTFTTYLDDLSFSSKTDFKLLIPEILNQVKLGGFYLNHQKISYKQALPEITGVFIDYNHSLTVNSIIEKRAKSNSIIKRYVKRVKHASRNSGPFQRNSVRS